MTGRKMYVCRSLLDELEDLMSEKGIDKSADGMRKMVEYVRVGREMERIMLLKFGRGKKRSGGLFGGLV